VSAFEPRVGTERYDVLLVGNEVVLLLELKFVPLGSLTLGGRLLSELTDEVLRALTTAQSSHMPEYQSGDSTLVRKVAHIMLGAQKQVAEQAAALRAMGRVGATMPLHVWVAMLVVDRIINILCGPRPIASCPTIASARVRRCAAAAPLSTRKPTT